MFMRHFTLAPLRVPVKQIFFFFFYHTLPAMWTRFVMSTQIRMLQKWLTVVNANISNLDCRHYSTTQYSTQRTFFTFFFFLSRTIMEMRTWKTSAGCGSTPVLRVVPLVAQASCLFSWVSGSSLRKKGTRWRREKKNHGAQWKSRQTR